MTMQEVVTCVIQPSHAKRDLRERPSVASKFENALQRCIVDCDSLEFLVRRRQTWCAHREARIGQNGFRTGASSLLNWGVRT
jgi:hypothetical protein